MTDETAPHIVCLMESSLDGRVDETRWSQLFDPVGEGDPDVFWETRASLKEDATLIGRETVRRHYCAQEFSAPTVTPPHDLKPFRGIRNCPTMIAVFDSHGRIAYERNVMGEDSILAVLGYECVSEEYLQFLRRREVSYTFAGPDGRDPAAAVRSMIADFGLKRFYLAGGGLLNGAFLRAGLIDELILILYPGLDGLRGVNSIFEYPGAPGEKPAAGQRLELTAWEQVRAGVMRLRYRVHRD